MAPSEFQVLLVEDNRVNRLVTERLLKRWGYTVVSAGNAEQALLAATHYQFSLILMNLHLPDSQGWELVSRIRVLTSTYRNIPIIAISADSSSLRHTEHMFSATLHKPYMPEQLQQLVQQVIARQVNEDAPGLFGVQQSLLLVADGDGLFADQLRQLYQKMCAQVLEDLERGRLNNAEHLSHVRHKHRSSLRLLKLYAAEAALDNLQFSLNQSTQNSGALQQRKEAVQLIFSALQQEFAQLPLSSAVRSCFSR